MFSWAKKNRTEVVLLVLILLVAAFFRLWRIDEYLPFLGDEGRDVRVVRRFLTDFDLMFIGPRTSIGDMYLGPLYYYFISPWLGAFRLSPVGPAVSVAVVGVATVVFVWVVGRQWFGEIAALVGAFFYGISPLVINHSRHSWNPNIMPAVALLSVYSAWRAARGEYRWLVILAVAYAFVLQSHYLGLLLAPTIVLVWLLTFLAKRKTENVKRFLVFSFFGFLVFVLLMSPLFIFDAKHEWHNVHSIYKFFAQRQETVSAKPWNALPDLWPLWDGKFVTRVLAASNREVGVVAAVLLAVGLAVLVIKQGQFRRLTPIALIAVWILAGLTGLGLLKQEVYDHYFGFMFPAPFLLLGAVVERLWAGKTKWLVASLLAVLTVVNLAGNPLRYPPQRQMQRVQEVNRKIIEEAGNRSFNFALIAKRNYEEGYLYFFELMRAPAKIADPQHSETITDQLFVVCEDPVCESPVYSPKAGIAHFGMSKVEKEWEVGGFRLYKLVHAQ